MLGNLLQVQQRPQRWSEPVEQSIQGEAHEAGLLRSGEEKAKGSLVLSSTIYWGVTETTGQGFSQRDKAKRPKATAQITIRETKFGHRKRVSPCW